jgi:pimeloyl-ACP methyl ester carboxylesterase
MTSEILAILDAEAVPKACVVGHSYGTLLASRLVKRFPERLHALCLVDPVCFGMYMPHLLHNFFYRRLALDLKRCAARLGLGWGPQGGVGMGGPSASRRPLQPSASAPHCFPPHPATCRPRPTPPRRTPRPLQFVLDLIVHFASRDLHLAAAFSRRFYWSDVIMWPEELPPGSAVVLGAADDLVHADEVRARGGGV